MASARKARIAIVGAGPAGASAGWHLASRGHAVTLIDRAAFPRDKTCGDWITPAALSELSALGLDRATLARLAPGHAIVTTSRLVAPDGRASTRIFDRPGACVPRRVLDHLIRERAIAAGCLPLERTVRDLAADTPLFAEYDHIVDARGATAGVANAIGLRGYLTVRKTAAAAEASHRVEIHTDGSYRRGYGWIFPVHAEEHTVRFNIGVGLWKDDSGEGHSVSDYYDGFFADNGAVRDLRAAAIDAARPVGYPVGLGLWRNCVAQGRVLRIGDAANLADPLTGDGIGNALASGRLVAEAITAAADVADAAPRWQRQFDSTLAPELRRALVLRRLLVATAAKSLAARVLDSVPALGTRLHRVIFGETGYRRR